MAKKTRTRTPPGPQLELAGALSVAFVNTAAARWPENSQLGVASYADLLNWGRRAGLLSASEAERLSKVARERSEEADAVLARALELREALRRIFQALRAGRPAPEDALQRLNTALREAFSHAALGSDVLGEEGLSLGWTGSEDALDRILWEVARSALETLTSPDAYRVRKCAAADCGLHFLDRTPSRRRKWCAVNPCGNRAKALRFYYRRGKKERDARINKLRPDRIRRKRPRTVKR